MAALLDLDFFFNFWFQTLCKVLIHESLLSHHHPVVFMRQWLKLSVKMVKKSQSTYFWIFLSVSGVLSTYNRAYLLNQKCGHVVLWCIHNLLKEIDRYPWHLSNGKQIKKIRYIYTMEYYLAIKNKDILKFGDKWI